jgi:hypothetical protein
MYALHDLLVCQCLRQVLFVCIALNFPQSKKCFKRRLYRKGNAHIFCLFCSFFKPCEDARIITLCIDFLTSYFFSVV